MNKEQLTKVCEELKISASFKYGIKSLDKLNDWQREAHPYMVTLYRGRNRLTVPFFQGNAITKGPTAADVLYCLTCDMTVGEQSFEDFCKGYGYNTDSRNAEKTWKECRKLAPKLRKFLGEHVDRVVRAEH